MAGHTRGAEAEDSGGTAEKVAAGHCVPGRQVYFMPWRALCLLAFAGVEVWAAEVSLTADPPLPVPNLLANPGMEEGMGEEAAAWRFSTATPDNFLAGRAENGRSGTCLWVKAKTGVMSGYFGQTVTVDPGAKYLCHGFYRLGGGRILIYAHSSVDVGGGRKVAVDERFYRGTMRGHWLSPVFLPPEVLGGPDPDEWFPFTLTVDVPDPMGAFTLSLGLYFQPGEVWFDDLWVGRATTELNVNVKADDGRALRRVVLQRTGAQDPVRDSGELAAGTRSFVSTVPDQPTDAVYELAVTLADGTVQRSRYPEAEAGEAR